ncbi:Conserved_hypothetical protein [Hexamita inflata]|uniref:Transmembrane protein n=1 Tax=Hexamita inflata TaxID=28002 RepID=A0AA86U6R6_9EUKA|nr:Conserved hypothetical protein [Hexamita inflata]
MNILIFVQMADTTFSQYQQEITECYSLDTNAIIFPFNNSVCLNLISANNNECKKFPQSVMLSMYMDVFDTVSPPYSPIGFVNDFNYSTTDFVCIPCLDPICQTKEFYLSSKIMLKVESTSRFTTVVCGQVTVQEEDRSNCFYPNRPGKDVQSQVIFKPLETCYYAAFNGQCPSISPFTLVNATVHISYKNGNVQSYLYLPTDTVNTYANNGTHLTFCFSDPNNLRESGQSYPLNATINIQIEQYNTAVLLTGYTFLIGTELTTNGYSSTVAFFQVVEIQLFGIISQPEKIQIANFLSQYQNGFFYSSMSIFSPSSNLVVNAFSGVIYRVQEEAVKYMGYYSNPEIPSQINQILTTEKLQDLIIYWDQFVTDTQNNVVFHSRKKVDNIWLTCWKNITVTWTSLHDVRVDIQNRAEQHNCQIQGNISVRAILGIMNDSVNDDVFPAFKLDIENYNINMTSLNMHSNIPNIKNIVSECQYVQFQLLYKSTGSYIENIEVNNWGQLEMNQNKTQLIVLFSCISITLIIELIRLKLQYKEIKKYQKVVENDDVKEEAQIIVEDFK